MKRRLRFDQQLQICLLTLLLLLVMGGGLSVYAQPANFELVASNEYLNLYINKTTTELAIEDVKTGKLWYTNPQERSSTSGYTLSRLSSQFTIVHDPKEVQKESYRFSVAYNQFDITPLTNGVRVDYTVVQEWKAEHYIPRMIKQERMDELILAKIEKDKDRDRIREYYDLIALVPLEGERVPIIGLNQDRVFGEYDVAILDPDYQENLANLNAMKAQLETADDAEKASLEASISKLEKQLNKEREDLIWRLINSIIECRLDVEKTDDVTFADLAHLVGSPTYLMGKIPRLYYNEMQGILSSIEYTPIECAEDHMECNLDPLIDSLQVFHVPMEYTLDGRNLVVRIPVDEIEWPVNVENRIGEKFTYPLHTIRVLENFHAANTSKEGYIFVPDGSGGLIYLNNGRLFASGYNDVIYGLDHTHNTPSEKQRYPETIRMPVFGLKQGDQAIFAIIEEGAAVARIIADISGRTDNYNRVYPEFTITPYTDLSIGIQTDKMKFSGSVRVYQARRSETDLVIRYAFLSNDDSTYAGMARYYRDYLIQKYGLQKVAAGENIPFYLELVGAIDKRQPILGIARDVVYPLTTFTQAKSILSSLQELGIGNMQVKYNGWLKGGLDHVYPSKASFEGKLGSAQELKDLISYANAQGYSLYPSVGFLRVYRDTLFNGFYARTDAARTLKRLAAMAYNYELDTTQQDPDQSYYLISPRSVSRLVDSFMADYQRYGFTGISLFDLAREANSDFNDNVSKLVDREQSADINAAQIAKIRSMGYKVMVDYGNAYAVPYADAIVNMPAWGSSNPIVNEEVPFYQMVVHGLVGYAAQPLNLASDLRREVLRMIESGGYPYFIGSYEQSSVVKGTDFNYLYALHYGDWLDDAAEIYELANSVLKDVQDQLIIDHARLAENVYQTVYENGKRVIVNYNAEPVEVCGQVVDGLSFVVMEGETDENSH